MHIKPYIGKEPYIFISYATKNSNIVLPIIYKLVSDGYRVWYDDGTTPESERDDIIAKHINDCKCIVVIMSQAYTASMVCVDELKLAKAKNKIILFAYLNSTQYLVSSSLQLRVINNKGIALNNVRDIEGLYSTYYFEECKTASCAPPPPCAAPPRANKSENVSAKADENYGRETAASDSEIFEPAVMGAAPTMVTPLTMLGGLLKKFSKKQSAAPTKTEKIEVPSKKKKSKLTVDSVQFSAVTTERIKNGEYLPVHVIMYEDEYRHEVDELLSAMPDKGKEVKGGYQEVERSSEIKVVLTSPDVDIDDGTETRAWRGKYIEFAFSVYIPESYAKKQAAFCATVYVNDIIFSKLRFAVTTEHEPITVERQNYKSGFMSYSSEDRNRVAAILQGMHKARPDMDIFFDVEKLRSGSNWQNELRSEIENRDILFLCWSQNAKKSEWVDREWRYAYELRGEDAIEPIPIESPKSCPPPDELKNKHFNDMLLYVINSNN